MRSMTMQEAKTPDNPGIGIMPPTVLYACLAAGVGLELAMPATVAGLAGFWRIAAGMAVALAGFAFMMAGHERFKKLGTAVRTNQPAGMLVVQGAYRVSRNPMYVGMSVMFLGVGLAVGSLWMLASYAPMGLYLALYVVPREEAYMKRKFGREYLDYQQSVRRWL